MLDDHTDSCVFEDIDVLMEHLTRSIDVRHHKDLIKRVEVLCKGFGQFRLPIRNYVHIPKGMDTSSKNK